GPRAAEQSRHPGQRAKAARAAVRPQVVRREKSGVQQRQQAGPQAAAHQPLGAAPAGGKGQQRPGRQHQRIGQSKEGFGGERHGVGQGGNCLKPTPPPPTPASPHRAKRPPRRVKRRIGQGEVMRTHGGVGRTLW
nr:hypothetical protein [Tanacetum cinerariifolium]